MIQGQVHASTKMTKMSFNLYSICCLCAGNTQNINNVLFIYLFILRPKIEHQTVWVRGVEDTKGPHKFRIEATIIYRK